MIYTVYVEMRSRYYSTSITFYRFFTKLYYLQYTKMKRRFFSATVILFLSLLFFACAKHTNYDAQGGELPSNFIAVKDSSFTPATLTVVSGSSITFVNNTATAKSIITTDSITIKATTIEPNSSFIFKKDTTGTFYYHLTNKPAAGGRFTLTP